MIEIERQFQLSPEQRNEFLQKAQFLTKKTLTDVYYDSPDISLMRRDLWLRKRNDVFELKAPAAPGDVRAEQYMEITDQGLILQYLHLEDTGDFTTTLAHNNICPYCVCTITREEYTLEGVTIDYDTTVFADGFTHSLWEAELLVQDKAHAEAAVQQLEEFMARHRLGGPVEDKLVAYLREQRPEHFQILQEKGVL